MLFEATEKRFEKLLKYFIIIFESVTEKNLIYKKLIHHND